MKILAIGDFHGKFQKKWERLIRKEKVDVVASNGDFLPFHYRKLWFKHCFAKDVELWEVTGKKKYKGLILEDLRRGEDVLKKLDKLPVPVVTTLGNIDYSSPDDVKDIKKPSGKKLWGWDRKNFFIERLKKYKNIKRVDYRFVRIGDFVFIGGRGHTIPGRVKSKAFKKHRAKLDKLFKKFGKENKDGRVIFLTHNMPYNMKLDKIGMKAHEMVRGKHYGSKMFRRIIEKHQPVVQIGGHIHESWGRQKLGKTMCVNTGAAHEGKAAVIEIVGKKVKVKFIK